MGDDLIYLRVPAHLEYRDLVSRAVSTACKVATGREKPQIDAASEAVVELVSAVGEAFNNAVLHAYGDRTDGALDLEIRNRGGVIEVTLRDEGRSFDTDDVPEPDLDALPESGMGLFIMRAFCDEVSYRPGPPNVLFLRKRVVP